MNREPGHMPVQPGSGRAARLRRRRKKRIALFASFAVIIILMIFAVVLLALEISQASSKLDNKKNNPVDSTTSTSGDRGQLTPAGNDYIAAEGNYKVSEGVLIQVNSSHEYVFPAVESRLLNVYDSRVKMSDGNYSFRCSYNTVRMDKTAFAAFCKMMDTFYTETQNQYALVSDAYRSYSDQEGKSIKAGFSDHHTGYLVSVKFYDDTGIYTSDNSTKYADAYTWLTQHAAEYGFVIRYPGGKTAVTGVGDYTYCYRYVGEAHAAYMSANNLCLEEYVSMLKSSYTFTGEHLKVTAGGHSYEIYYIPSTEKIYVPASSRGYEVSGDNDSGYIVTVTLN